MLQVGATGVEGKEGGEEKEEEEYDDDDDDDDILRVHETSH
jgi:hypothetical protein